MNQKYIDKLVPNEFYWDDMEGAAYIGVHNPQEIWNGYVIPYLSMPSVMRLKEYLDKRDDGYKIHYDGKGGIILDDGTERIPVEPISKDGQQYYGVFGYEWTWNPVKDYLR